MTTPQISQITSNDLAIIDGEHRMLDLDLASALGFSKAHNIRDLIKRHKNTHENFGKLFFRKCGKIGRGRPGTEFLLNKKQCLFICAKSDTDISALITIQMVEIFDQVTMGDVVKVRSHLRRKPVKNTVSYWKGQLKEAQDRLAALGYVPPLKEYRQEDRILALDMLGVKRQLDELFYRISAAGGLPAPAHIARKVGRGASS